MAGTLAERRADDPWGDIRIGHPTSKTGPRYLVNGVPLSSREKAYRALGWQYEPREPTG